MRIVAVLTLAGLSAATHAATPPSTLSVISDKALNESLNMGENLESRTDGDVNGDGALDCIYVINEGGEKRVLNVLIRDNVKALRYHPVAEMKLSDAPLGAPTLSVTKGVVKVEDLTGGTTAMSAIYRLRFDPAKNRMRLIGMDATLYSRTFAHDGYEFSWNLMTGDLDTTLLALKGEGADASYDYKYKTRSKRPSKPLYAEEVEDPEYVMVDIRKK